VESAVVAGLSIVSVTTGENDNAHRIFESLNNTGLKLTQGDLLRNYLFMQLPTRADEVYTTLWLPLQNLLSNEELETLFWLDLVQQDPKVRQTEIYAGQQRRMRDLQDESQVRAEVERFLALGRLYDVMLRPEKEKDDAVRFRLARLRAWRTTTTFPITLHLMERRSLGDIDSDELARALLYLESYLVRRLVFGRYSDGLNTTLLAATADIQGQDDPADALQRFLSSGRKHFASDDQIRQAVMTAPFYTTGRAAHRKLILRWIEESYGSKEPVDLDSATIEHVMPQTLTEEWERALADQLEARQDLREVHTELLHTLGNLTLTGYNSELSNGPFSVKRAELAKSGIRMNQEISAEPVWGPAQIRARAERLADRIVGIWPGPSAEAASGVAHTAWQTLSDAVEAIPAGSWTSYGELARLIGSHPVPVGTYLARTALPHAHRVLQA
ncbi:GmrSD restriction endonuclease domain-containing protein, partial [Arcanobacterium phocae]|uniref:GmrSD restriction endonuclease domain-containing protein n=1 Tax=Arcanobacterium phocae TaxID=131112 RepID=UPI001C0FCCAB